MAQHGTQSQHGIHDTGRLHVLPSEWGGHGTASTRWVEHAGHPLIFTGSMND